MNYFIGNYCKKVLFHYFTQSIKTKYNMCDAGYLIHYQEFRILNLHLTIKYLKKLMHESPGVIGQMLFFSDF